MTTTDVLDKNSEISEIIHTLRHDVRNYLSAIEGYAYLLKEEPGNPDYLERIFRNVTNINNLFSRCVDWADSYVTFQPTEVDLAELIREVRANLPCNLQLNIPDNLQTIQGDPPLLKVLFDQLLRNSATHGKASVVTVEEGPGKQLLITNNGEPINEHPLKSLWEAPQSFKDNSGMGLPHVRKILELHSWTIELKENTKGKVQFILELA